MLQEEYKLSVSAGEEAFLQGVEMLLAQKKQESAERGDSAVYIHLICTAVSPPLALAMADIWQRIWPESQEISRWFTRDLMIMYRRPCFPKLCRIRA